jgi:hypothetical protein
MRSGTDGGNTAGLARVESFSSLEIYMLFACCYW